MVENRLDVSEATMQLWTQKRRNGSKERRVIPLDQTLQRILHEQRHQTGSTAYVFINPNTGRPHTANLPGIRYMLARLCEKAEVKAFGFHSIRHYFAVCLMASQRASLADIQLLLGHQRATTTDIYLRSLEPQKLYFSKDSICVETTPSQIINRPLGFRIRSISLIAFSGISR